MRVSIKECSGGYPSGNREIEVGGDTEVRISVGSQRGDFQRWGTFVVVNPRNNSVYVEEINESSFGKTTRRRPVCVGSNDPQIYCTNTNTWTTIEVEVRS